MLDVTSGEIAFNIDHESVRAVLPGSSGTESRLIFTYQGDTERLKPLTSGQMRYQLGLKLLASDGDNVLYAMWRFRPDGPRIHVQSKVAGVYRQAASVYFDDRLDLEPVVGRRYELAARVDGLVVRVWLDGAIRWVGEVHESALDLYRHGALSGLRTDNARLHSIDLLDR